MLLLDDDDELPASPQPSESELAAQLGPVGMHAIDTALTSHARSCWLKVARVVFDALRSGGFEAEDDIVAVHVRQVANLVASGVLEAQGNLRRPRWSEIRLSQ
jgi:hypothetical protein